MADLDTIKERVVGATKAAADKVGIADIILEIDHDDDGDDFLRVIIEVKHSDRATDTDYEAWLEAIEKAVGEVDSRYPSVRFADAA
jgi:hypothetical protein